MKLHSPTDVLQAYTSGKKYTERETYRKELKVAGAEKTKGTAVGKPVAAWLWVGEAVTGEERRLEDSSEIRPSLEVVGSLRLEGEKRRLGFSSGVASRTRRRGAGCPLFF